MRAADGLHLDVSLGTLELDAFLYPGITFFRSEMTYSVPQKLIHKWVSPPRPKRYIETQITHVTKTWQRGLYAQEGHTLSKLVKIRALPGEESWRQSCAVREEHVFFCCPGRLQEKPEPCVGFKFQHHKGEKPKPVFVSCFRSQILVQKRGGRSYLFSGFGETKWSA